MIPLALTLVDVATIAPGAFLVGLIVGLVIGYRLARSVSDGLRQ